MTRTGGHPMQGINKQYVSQVSRTCTLGSGMVAASPLAANTGAEPGGQPGRLPAPCGPAAANEAGTAVTTTESLLFSATAASRGFFR